MQKWHQGLSGESCHIQKTPNDMASPSNKLNVLPVTHNNFRFALLLPFMYTPGSASRCSESAPSMWLQNYRKFSCSNISALLYFVLGNTYTHTQNI